jgi:hemolysin D
MPTFSSGQISANFDARYNDILSPPPKPDGNWLQIEVAQAEYNVAKIFNPTMNDVGYANMNVGTAILFLNRFLNNPENYLVDPSNTSLNFLQQYANDPAKFVADLTDPTNNTVFAISAIISKQGYTDFTGFFGQQFLGASESDKAAYLTTFFKQGEPMIMRKIPDYYNDALWPPTLPPANAGSGGPFTQDNYSVFKKILDPSSQLSAADDRQTANGSAGFSVSPQTATVSVPSAFYNAVLAMPVQSDLAGSINFNLISWNLSRQAASVQWPDPASSNYQPSTDTFVAPDFNSAGIQAEFNYQAIDANTNPWDSPPVVLDLTGKGINVTQLGSSNTFFNVTGDGLQRRTAWAGVGNGVLMYDSGNGNIDDPNAFEFIRWDPTATSDMQALADVFDANHDGKLDVGDAGWSKFKVLVTNADGTTTLETLDQLGITSINLTSDTKTTTLADGSQISGETTFTRSDGSTGTAADVSFAHDAQGHVVQQTTTHNADGSTSIDIKQLSADGSLAGESISTVSADGLTKTLHRDTTGNGIFDSVQTDATVVNADGSNTETLSDLNGAGVLLDRTITTTSADGLSKTILRDLDGNGNADQSEIHLTNAVGSTIVAISDLDPNGTFRDRTVMITSSDGLTKRTDVDHTGSGTFDTTATDVIVVATDGSRTETVTDLNVDEADHVTAGQLLIDLDPTEARADLDAPLYSRRQAELDAEVARVLLSRDPDEAFHGPDGADPVLVEQNHSRAQREIEKQLATIAGYEADIAQKDAALTSNDAQFERARLTIPLLAEKNETAKGLYDKQYGTRPPVLDSEQQLVEKRAELKTAETNVHQIEAERRSIMAKLAEAKAGYLADATDRRTKALTKIAQLDQDITKARQKESYRRLVAPVDGTVQGLKIHTPGAVVTTADTLMTVVPDGTGIEVDCLVQNKDIGFVAEGQDVAVKLEAFPFTRYGLVPGRVRKLGRDAASNPNAAPGTAAALAAAQQSGQPGAPPAELAYPAKVTLLQDWIMVAGRREPIRPGMRVSAEIKTGYRRVIEYLLSPVMQALQEAGRER